MAELMMDPVSTASLEAQRQCYIRNRDAAADPELKFHFAMMAEITPAMGRAIYAYGMGLPHESIYRAIAQVSSKLVAEALLNTAGPDAEVDWPLLGRQHADNVRKGVETAVRTGTMEIGNG